MQLYALRKLFRYARRALTVKIGTVISCPISARKDWSMREYVWPFIMQKKLASSVWSLATSQARKKIISLFLLSPEVLSSKTLSTGAIAPEVATTQYDATLRTYRSNEHFDVSLDPRLGPWLGACKCVVHS